jgi:hypothetical protein
VTRAIASLHTRAWEGIPIGTRVSVRALGGFRFAAETASEAFEERGVAAIRLVFGNGVSYVELLANVSLAGEEPPPVVPTLTVAAALDPVPVPERPVGAVDVFVLATAACILAYGAGLGLLALLDWVSQ